MIVPDMSIDEARAPGWSPLDGATMFAAHRQTNFIKAFNQMN
jgi:hypothetical protein